MNCPECQRRIADVAETCRCGWQKQSYVQKTHIACARDGCQTSANTRVKTPTGWANFCQADYDAHFAKQAKEFAASRGLDTREKQYQFVREKLTAGKLFRDIPAPREPGEDSHEDIYGSAA